MRIFTFLVLSTMFFSTTINAQWEQLEPGQTSFIRKMSVINDNVVWVTDQDKNSFSYTTDGGTTWITKNYPSDMQGNVGGFCAISETVAFSIVSSGEKGVYKTTDSGDNWTKQTTGLNNDSPYPDFVYFWNENDGVCIGDAYPNDYFEIYTTTDGGEQWNAVEDENMPNGNQEWSYNSNLYIKVRDNSVSFITNSGRIFVSNDKGYNWSVKNTPVSDGSKMSFYFKDATNGLLSYANTTDELYELYSTSDGGVTWSIIATTEKVQHLKYVATENAYYSTNTSHGLLYSTDDGQTWTSHSSLEGARMGATGVSSTGVIYIGGWGYVYKSTDPEGANLELTGATKIDNTSIELYFDQDVEEASSEDPANYEVIYNTTESAQMLKSEVVINVVSATRDDGDNTIVRIVTDSDLPDTDYKVDVNNVKDLNGVSIINDGNSSEVEFIATAIKDEETGQINVYPNPVTDKIKIASSVSLYNSTIEIYSISGELVSTTSLNDKNEINVSDLSKGVYLIKIKTDKVNIMQKVIKK